MILEGIAFWAVASVGTTLTFCGLFAAADRKASADQRGVEPVDHNHHAGSDKA
ncbi:hypothetical protein [Sphingomonas sp. CARO-RG-8B-R24-01]|uniref:hypothetical protein n=1 Tax=Sphingomonas sp. CARO-RG-8B-R24-01 TaxID=2914831 RepID=UPI001F58BA86|nr:hypothetical protein [Sphingomonas sp. CARO-RG-8B-R24-01]